CFIPTLEIYRNILLMALSSLALPRHFRFLFFDPHSRRGAADRGEYRSSAENSKAAGHMERRDFAYQPTLGEKGSPHFKYPSQPRSAATERFAAQQCFWG